VSRPSGLQAGVEVAWRGQVHVVVAVTGVSVRLVDAAGDAAEVPLATLVNDPALELVADVRAPLVASDVADTVRAGVLERARWWENHILEVLTGRPGECGRDHVVRAEYDPAATTLRQRELAKPWRLGMLYLTSLRTLLEGHREQPGIDGAVARSEQPAAHRRIEHGLGRPALSGGQLLQVHSERLLEHSGLG